MTRAYLPPSSWEDQPAVLSKEESHHVLNVLRKQVGDQITVFDGAGKSAGATILSIDDKCAGVELSDIREHAKPKVRSTLVMALIREQQMDLVIQKATELGVSEIRLFQPEHAVVKWKAEKADKKLARWNDIILGAAKQSGNPWLPTLEEPASLAKVLEDVSGTVLYGDLQEGAASLAVTLQEQSTDAVAVVIGPEGDFGAGERDLLKEKGTPVSFGDLTLRAETAAIYALSLVQAL